MVEAMLAFVSFGHVETLAAIYAVFGRVKDIAGGIVRVVLVILAELELRLDGCDDGCEVSACAAVEEHLAGFLAVEGFYPSAPFGFAQDRPFDGAQDRLRQAQGRLLLRTGVGVVGPGYVHEDVYERVAVVGDRYDVVPDNGLDRRGVVKGVRRHGILGGLPRPLRQAQGGPLRQAQDRDWGQGRGPRAGSRQAG